MNSEHSKISKTDKLDLGMGKKKELLCQILVFTIHGKT